MYSERFTSRNDSDGSTAMRWVLSSHSRSRRKEFLSWRTDCERAMGASVDTLGSLSINLSSTESVIARSVWARAMAHSLAVQRLHGVDPANALEQLLLLLRIRKFLAGFHHHRERTDHDLPILPFLQFVIVDRGGDVVEQRLRNRFLSGRDADLRQLHFTQEAAAPAALAVDLVP